MSIAFDFSKGSNNPSFPDKIIIPQHRSGCFCFCGESMGIQINRRVATIYNQLLPVIRPMVNRECFPNREVYGLAQLFAFNKTEEFDTSGFQLNKKNESKGKEREFALLSRTVTLLGNGVFGCPVMLKLQKVQEGSYKKVNKVIVLKWLPDRFEAAIHAEYRPKKKITKKGLSFFNAEIELYRGVDSLYILGKHSHIAMRSQNPNKISALYELCETNLFDLLDEFEAYPTREKSLEVFQVLRDVVSGLVDLRNSGILHLDIKLENILVRNVNGVAQGVIADLGLSASAKNMDALYSEALTITNRVFATHELVRQPVLAAMLEDSRGVVPRRDAFMERLKKSNLEVGQKERMIGAMLDFFNQEVRKRVKRRGSLEYLAPEYLKNFFPNPKCDIYSFGIMLRLILAMNEITQFLSVCAQVNLTRMMDQTTSRYPHTRPNLDQIKAVLDGAIAELS